VTAIKASNPSFELGFFFAKFIGVLVAVKSWVMAVDVIERFSH